jgi:hypothetical protein
VQIVANRSPLLQSVNVDEAVGRPRNELLIDQRNEFHMNLEYSAFLGLPEHLARLLLSGLQVVLPILNGRENPAG